jgi:hypothetical protein
MLSGGASMNAIAMWEPMRAVMVWAALAFVLWVAFAAIIRRLRIPHSVAVAAALSWVIARLCLWAIPVVVEQMQVWLATKWPV